jgi:hypothetical protein
MADDPTFVFDASDDVKKVTDVVDAATAAMKDGVKKLTAAQQQQTQFSIAMGTWARNNQKIFAGMVRRAGQSMGQNFQQVAQNNRQPYVSPVVPPPPPYQLTPPGPPTRSIVPATGATPIEVPQFRNAFEKHQQQIAAVGKGLEGLVAGAARAGPALTGLVGAVSAATEAMRSAVDIKKGNLDTVGERNLVAARFSRETRGQVSKEAALDTLNGSINPQEAMRLMSYYTAQMQSGRRVGVRNMATAFNALNTGGTSLEQTMSLVEANRYGALAQRAQEFPDKTPEGTFTRAKRAANLQDYAAAEGTYSTDRPGAIDAELFDPAERRYKAQNPFMSSLPGGTFWRTWKTSGEGAQMARDTYGARGMLGPGTVPQAEVVSPVSQPNFDPSTQGGGRQIIIRDRRQPLVRSGNRAGD